MDLFQANNIYLHIQINIQKKEKRKLLKKCKKKYERTLTQRDTLASKFVRREWTERLADLEVEEERRVCFIGNVHAI